MTPFFTVPFKLSEEAFTWITDFIEPIVTDYQLNAPQNSALISLTPDQVDTIKQSKVWEEILMFSNEHNLTDPWPQLFIYKQLPHPRPSNMGNPHIDTYGPGGIAYTASVRFNILLAGEDTTEMVWWNKNQMDKSLITQIIQRPDNTLTGRVQVVGSTLEEQWKNLGEPGYRATHLAKVQEYASFVRTDIVHALNWTGNKPRVVFSIRFKDTWDELTRSSQS